MVIKSRAWSEIAQRYRYLVEHGWDIEPMARLVQEIASSRYVHGVYAATYRETLYLAQTPEFGMNQNTIRVDFEQGRFVFTYNDMPYINETWKKECGRDEGFGTFEYMMSRLKWFLN